MTNYSMTLHDANLENRLDGREWDVYGFQPPNNHNQPAMTAIRGSRMGME